jgi:uncharacterized protein
MTPRPATSTDFEAVLTLNQELVHFLSPLTHQRLGSLHRQAELHRVLEVNGTVIAFVLALREGASYDSVNYQWFAQRYDRFLYVDRVVVSIAHQGSGAGRVLYETVFTHAKATGVAIVTSEYYVDPPNPVSERFHSRFGFVEVGRQSVAGGKKSVSLQASRVNSA